MLNKQSVGTQGMASNLEEYNLDSPALDSSDRL